MKHLLIGTICGALLAVPCAASAKDHSGGGGHGQEGPKGQTGGSFVPPGLAKKPYGLPPGQAKKMYLRGQALPTTYLQPRYYVGNPAQYHLTPAPRGYRWVLVEDNAYLANTRTGLIASVVASLMR